MYVHIYLVVHNHAVSLQNNASFRAAGLFLSVCLALYTSMYLARPLAIACAHKLAYAYFSNLTHFNVGKHSFLMFFGRDRVSTLINFSLCIWTRVLALLDLCRSLFVRALWFEIDVAAC